MKTAAFVLLLSALAAASLSAGQIEILKPQSAGPNGNVLFSSSTNGLVLVSEGAGEAASLGSYSIRLMEDYGIGDPGKLKAGVVLPRDGSIVKAWRGDLRGLGQDELAVWLQSAGSGSYGSLEMFVIGATNLIQVALPNPSQGIKGYMGHDRFDIDGKGIHWSCPLYGKHLEFEIATNLGSVSITFPRVRVANDSNVEPRGGEARRRYDATTRKWIRD